MLLVFFPDSNGVNSADFRCKEAFQTLYLDLKTYVRETSMRFPSADRPRLEGGGLHPEFHLWRGVFGGVEAGRFCEKLILNTADLDLGCDCHLRTNTFR